MKFGVWGTFSVAVVFAFLMFGPVPNWLGVGPNKWGYLWNAPPNEVGDTLAGIAGTLAFLWIIVTVMLQSKELSEQRKELKLTRKEFERMAVAQEAQKKVADEQVAIFQLENRKKAEMEADALVFQLLREVSQLIQETEISIHSRQRYEGHVPSATLYFASRKELTSDDNYLRSVLIELSEFFEKATSFSGKYSTSEEVEFPEAFVGVLARIEQLRSSVGPKSASTERVLKMSCVYKIPAILKGLEALPLWSKSNAAESQKTRTAI
ncbi:hypothetical protein [Planktotalea sp.]|uniref:hypothetical protein n=1 Tax=Planktotalea sp. TaxID=2029877 RepID=UPI003D6AFA3A